MKKFSIIFLSVLFALMLSLCVFSASADVTQPVATDPVPTAPPVTAPVINPTEAPTAPVTGSTDPTGDIDPTGVTEPTAQVTEPVTEFTRPTEYDEDNEPNTYSDYVSPAPIYTPSDQDFEKKDWEEIELDIKEGANSAGVGSFEDIKKNTAKGDQKSPLLLILCIVFWCLALSCLTFVILYKPKTAKAVSARKSSAPSHRRTDPKVSDDYNDGY